MDNLDSILAKDNLRFEADIENLEENKRRALSVRKMIKNYKKTEKTNYRLLLNHIIIIQNDIGVQKTVLALRSMFDKKEEIHYLNAFLYFLKYIQYKPEDSFCYNLYKKIVKEVN